MNMILQIVSIIGCVMATVLPCSVASSDFETFIIGGDNATKGEFPFMAYVRNAKYRAGLCSGVLVSRNTVLTAASCLLRQNNKDFADPIDITIFVGRFNYSDSDGVQTESIEKFIIAEDFFINGTTSSSDIALIKLRRNLQMTSTVKTVALPPNENFTTGIGTKGTVLGWGGTAAGSSSAWILQKAEFKTTSNQDCVAEYGDFYKPANKIFCANASGKRICTGDEGGPFLVAGKDGKDPVLYGISLAINDSCAEVNKPVTFALVPKYVQWIKENYSDNGASHFSLISPILCFFIFLHFYF